MKYLLKSVLFFIFTIVFANFATAQNIAQPRQEKLLNGLKILIWNEPKSDKVSLKLRVHSGSAFDPKDKTGVMAMLGEILFPNEQTKIFFEEDLNGKLEVTSNYDYIQITASGKSDEFLSIIETLATAVSNPQITQENFAKIRDARLKKVEELQKDPAYVADMAVAKRLLGDFPYGRPADGTPESLKVIDRADLLFAKDRFLTADNATLAISGNVKADFAFMAARRLFGAWKKSEKLVPATFRQPDEPQKEMQIINSTQNKTSEFRIAMRGLSRNDKDFFASKILEKVIAKRVSAREGQNSIVGSSSNLLPGIFSIGVSKWNLGKIKKEGNMMALPNTEDYQSNFLKTPVSSEEFSAAKNELVSDVEKRDFYSLWLDADTFKISDFKNENQNISKITQADVQRVLEKMQTQPTAKILLFKDEPAENSANNNH